MPKYGKFQLLLVTQKPLENINFSKFCKSSIIHPQIIRKLKSFIKHVQYYDSKFLEVSSILVNFRISDDKKY